MNLYNPHLTISRLKDKKMANRIGKTLKLDIADFSVDTVSIYRMGKHGTCVELVKDFKLKL